MVAAGPNGEATRSLKARGFDGPVATAGAPRQPAAAAVESLIVRLKAEKPHWGARKIRELLVRRLDGDVRVPAKNSRETGFAVPLLLISKYLIGLS